MAFELALNLGRSGLASAPAPKELKETASLSTGISWLCHCVLPIVDLGYNPILIRLVGPNFLCFTFLCPFVFHIKEIKYLW